MRKKGRGERRGRKLQKDIYVKGDEDETEDEKEGQGWQRRGEEEKEREREIEDTRYVI